MTRTDQPCSLCGDLLIRQNGALVCALCDMTTSEPVTYADAYPIVRFPITHCVRGCGSRLTIADRGTVCRQCVLERQP